MPPILWETTYICLVLFVVSFGLHYYAFGKEIQNDEDEIKTSELKKDEHGNKVKYKTGNAFLDKWLDFGGGYYGTVAMVKLLLNEFSQFIGLISDWEKSGEMLSNFGIQTLVQLFVQQFINFADAISWPKDYFGQYPFSHVAIFVVTTYITYEVSRKFARKKINLKRAEISNF